MSRRMLVTVMSVLLMTGTACADVTPSPALRLAEAVRCACASDASLQALDRRVAALQTAVELVGAPAPLTLRLSAVTGIAPEDANALTQIVELGGQPSMRRKAAAALLSSAEAARDERRQEVASETTRLYLAALNADGQLEVARQDLAAQDALLEIARRRYEAGDVPQSHLVRATRERAHAEREVAGADQMRAGARQALVVYIGGGSLADEALVSPELPYGEPPHDLAPLYAQALEGRPEVRRLRAEVDERTQQARLSRAEGSPFLELQAYGTQLNGLQLYGNNAQAGARATLNWPLVDWGRRRGEVAQVRAALEEARARLAAAEKDAGLRLQEAVARWRTRAGQRAAMASEVASAQRLVDMLERGYVGGAVVQLELVEARRALIDARREALRLQYEETSAALDTWRALGRPLMPEKSEAPR